MTTTRTPTCRCGTPSQTPTCDDCLNQLDALLNELTDLDDELATTLARTHGATLTPGAASSETPLPYDDRAALVERRLATKLRTWIRKTQRAGIDPDDHPRDTITAQARWLNQHLDHLAHQRYTTGMLYDLTATAEAVRKVVYFKPAAQTFLGRCDTVTCDGEVYAPEGADTGKCRTCSRAYLTATKRASLEAALDDRLCTAAEIAHLVAYLGDLHLTRDQVRKRVNLWHARRRITASGTDQTGEPLFRYGTARDLLYVTQEGSRP